MKITRRGFGKILGTLWAGSMLGLTGCNPDKGDKVVPSQVQSEQRSSLGQTKLRQLGKTKLVLSPVGFDAQRTRDADLIRYALDQGMNHIETAWDGEVLSFAAHWNSTGRFARYRLKTCLKNDCC